MLILLISIIVLLLISYILTQQLNLSTKKKNFAIIICLVLLTSLIYFYFINKNKEKFLKTPVDEVYINTNILSNKDIQRLLHELPSQKFYTARHGNYPTTDFPLHHISWLEQKIASSSLFDKIAEIYNVDINDFQF